MPECVGSLVRYILMTLRVTRVHVTCVAVIDISRLNLFRICCGIMHPYRSNLVRKGLTTQQISRWQQSGLATAAVLIDQLTDNNRILFERISRI